MDTNKNNNSSDIDLGNIIRLILMQSKLIIVFVTFLTALSIGLYLVSTKTYQVNSLVQIIEDETSPFNDSFFEIYAGGTNTTSFNSIAKIYKSRSRMIDIIESNKLQIQTENLKLAEKEIFKQFEIKEEFSFEKEGNFNIKFMKTGFTLLDNNGLELLSSDYDKTFDNRFFTILITSPKFPLPKEAIKIKLKNPERMFRDFAEKFDIKFSNDALRRAFSQNNGEVLEISYKTTDRVEGMKVLDYANDLFIKLSIQDESEEARKAIKFLDSKINTVRNEVEQSKLRLRKFKENENTVNVDLEVESIINSLSELDQAINKLDIDIARAVNTYTSSNRIYLDLLDQKSILIEQRSQIEEKINNLPVAQQSYLDLLSELERNEQTFLSLEQSKLQYSIKEASTLGNMKIIDYAYIEKKISPQSSMIIITFLGSLFLAIMIAIYRGLFFIPITNPAELEDGGITNPIIGVVSNFDKSEFDKGESEKLSQSVESIIVSIKSVLKTKLIDTKNQAKTIVLTSPTQNNGKSTLSKLIATRLSKLNHKVLLIDGDFKRGDLHKAFDINKYSFNDFDSLNKENISRLKVADSLYVMPKVTKLTSSFQFLYSKTFNEKMELFKEYFDFIIIDTAPILSVSDTSILLSEADAVFSIVRHSVTKMNEIKQALTIFEQNGKEMDGIVYNDYKIPSSYYGYYGLYGNYQYQYYANKYLYESYGYNEKND